MCSVHLPPLSRKNCLARWLQPPKWLSKAHFLTPLGAHFPTKTMLAGPCHGLIIYNVFAAKRHFRAVLAPYGNPLWDAVSTMHRLFQFFLSPGMSLERFGGEKGSPRVSRSSERRLENRSKSSKNTLWCHMGSQGSCRSTSPPLKSQKIDQI